MNIRALEPAEAAKVRNEWQQAVEALVSQVRTWAEAQGWKTEQVFHHLREDGLGEYTVPGLEIETPRGRLELEPIGRDVLGAEGRVDFQAWPSFYRVMLLPMDKENWIIRTDSGLNWPQPW